MLTNITNGHYDLKFDIYNLQGMVNLKIYFSWSLKLDFCSCWHVSSNTSKRFFSETPFGKNTITWIVPFQLSLSNVMLILNYQKTLEKSWKSRQKLCILIKDFSGRTAVDWNLPEIYTSCCFFLNGYWMYWM